jgi:SAM-dependent methyltransferase
LGTPPDDNAAREERLRRWAAEQSELAARRSQIPAREPLWDRIASRFFDRGVRTGGRTLDEEHLESDRIGYVASAWRTLPRAFRHIGVSADDVFIDFGCGKGRVVHQAAKRPLKKVIGIEVSAPLAEVASELIEEHRDEYRCEDVEIVVADAREYRVPDDLTIAYFFHPFFGEVFDQVLEDIIGSIDRNPRRVSIIYAFPRAATQVEATGRFRLVKQLRGSLRDNTNSLHRTNIYESV